MSLITTICTPGLFISAANNALVDRDILQEFLILKIVMVLHMIIRKIFIGGIFLKIMYLKTMNGMLIQIILINFINRFTDMAEHERSKGMCWNTL